ncbi:MAG: DUF4290 domain-containing protein [Paludibacteraceae bacterium]|nr:DUF4290 domain-containing protein [Paludibacteraceae bacterium]
MRNYGRIIQNMVQVACTETDTAKREAMVIYIGQCMRQKNLVWNKDQESGASRIIEDIRILSNGTLDCEFPAFQEAMSKKMELKKTEIKKKK